MSVQCPRCGFRMEEGNAACPNCGFSLQLVGGPGTELPLGGPPWQQLPHWSTPVSPGKRRTRVVATVAGGALFVLVIVASTAALVARSGASSHRASLPKPTPTPTTIAGPTATPQVFFQDPLTSNAKGWNTDSGCVFKSDGLHITDDICVAPAGRLGNVDVTVTAQAVNGDLRTPLGVVVHDTSEGANRYDFDITTDGNWAIFRYANQQLTRLVNYQPSASIHQGIGATNLLEVRVVGTHLQFFANGDLLGQTDDSALIDGYIGLLSNKGLETVFSNLQIGVP